MRVLLDTNIIIHRENKMITNSSIGYLFYWLDRLNYTKIIHPFSVNEINGYNDIIVQDLYKVKLAAYNELQTIAVQTEEFKNLMKSSEKTRNDLVDNQLLYELYSNRVDILITEDRKMRNKAVILGISSRVYSINSFIEHSTNANPDLIKYRALSVKKERFGNVEINNSFFDTFRNDYIGFDKWFAKKCDEEAYLCKDENGKIQGFLYLKIENNNENYNDINPIFLPKKRLKVGTFKVEATGFRLGERFLKIIFDNAILQKVDEVYVTLFKNRPELMALENLLINWGFEYHGEKKSNNKIENVLVKTMNSYDKSISPKRNFPNIFYESTKYFLPIEPEYHTRLLPDSILNNENEIDFMQKTAEKYALEKVYISSSFKRDMHPGDIVFIYRKGEDGTKKGYTSVISTIAVINDIKYNFLTKNDFFEYCQNRTVFSHDELENIWRKKEKKILVVKFLAIKNLTKRIILKELWENGIIDFPNGPRPFDTIKESDFEKIISMSNTNIYRNMEK